MVCHLRLHSCPQQAAVGSHRLAVAGLVAALLGAGSVVLDEAVACSGALPRLVHLCFAHPACNALHASALKLLRCAPSCCRTILARAPSCALGQSALRTWLPKMACRPMLHSLHQAVCMVPALHGWGTCPWRMGA